MADVNANIGVNIDTSAALAQLKNLQRQISQFHSSIARSSESAALAQRSLQKNLIGSINSIGAFSAELRTVRTSAESFTNSLEKNKFGLREYFRYAGASTKTFGRLFKSEFDTIGRVAEERVKTLQTQYIKMGRNASGAMEAIAVRPTSLNMQDYGTRTAIAAQKQALFNQLMKQGSTNLLNFGKNTQWAGRQLMVGFTIPLSIVGSTASKAFMDMELQALKFRKVYGDLFTPRAETQKALDNITELGRQFTKYGISVSQTVGLSAEAAAAGFQGLDLQRQTTEATRLSILGQVDSQKALETTISLQNAFGMSSDKLADSINFLNAVENQTVVSLDDITTAIPKVAPVIQQLGGDVKDLTFFIAAMKEGGINASEGANALKSGLAALINPTKKASEMLAQFGINAKEIVVKNKGDLKTTVVEFATALNQLDPLNRAQAIEQMFGKFQFARLSTLFANVAKDGNQASRVLDLANSSVEKLSALSEQELGMTAASSMNKFKKSVEDLKFALIPVGEAFLEAATPIIEFVGSVLEKFGNLSDGTKKLITFLTVGVGAIGPIFLMTFGLIANALANGLKGVMILRQGYLRLTGQSQILGEQTQYLNTEQLEAAAAAHSLDQSHAKLTQRFAAETTELNKLIAAYQSGTRAAQSFAFNNPGMMMPGRAAKKFASGIVSVPGPKGAGDVVPAMLSPGEAVIPAKFVEKYGPLIQGMVAGNIPGYQIGKGFKNATMFLPESINTAMGQNVGRGVPTKNVEQYLGSSGGASMAPLLAVMARELKVGINNPKFKQEFVTVANLFAQTATDALNKSGREFIKDADIEEIIVPALRNAAKGIKIAGKDIDVALENAVNQIRTVGPLGAGSGSAGGMGRTAFPGSYRTSRIAAQTFATEQNPKMFQQTERFSKSKNKTVKSFQTFNPTLDKFETATMSHITTSITASANELTKKMTPYLGDVGAKITQSITKNITQGATKQANIVNGVDFNKLRAQIAGTGGGANMVAGVRARQQRQYNKEDDAILGAMGIKSARSAITATEKEAQVASPSRRTIKIGQDIARGLEVGMADRQDDVARAGSQLSQAATGGVRGGAQERSLKATKSYVTNYGAGNEITSIDKSIRRQQEKLKKEFKLKDVGPNIAMSPQISQGVKDHAKNLQASNEKFAALNGKIMGGTFALTSLAGVASMAGGNLGKLSGIVFQLSGVMFALSTVLQILPGRFKTFLLGIKPGPLLLFTAALAAGAGIIKLINNAREKERLKIEGLGDAATLTSDKLKTLGGFFGVTTKESPFERLKTQKTDLQIGSKQRSEVEGLRKDEGFQKEFKNDISVLKNATNKEAQLIFESIAIQLKGSGFANEQIDNIIKALQLEANKSNVKIDLKNIDLTTEAGQAKLSNNIKALTDSVGATFNKGMKKTFYRVVEDGKIIVKPFTELGDEAKKSIDFASKAITANINGLSAQLDSGVIDAKQFSSAFESISNNIKNMPKPQSIALMSNLMTSLPENLVKSAQGINDVSSQLLLLQAQASGVVVTSAVIGAMLTLQRKDLESHERRTANDTVTLFKNNMKTMQKVMQELNKTKPFKDVGTPVEPDSYDKAYSTLTNFFNAQEALITRNRRVGEEAAKAAVNNAEEQVKKIEKQIDAEEKLIDTNERSIKVLTRKIEEQYDRPIQALQDESAILNNNLSIIREQEEAINNQYDNQIKSLEKISSIGQEIANQEKSRLTIADALTSGDIASAAAAVQDSRAQAAASRIDGQTKAIEESRKQALAGVTVGGMNKDDIEARTFEISQKTFLLEQQRKILQNEVVVLQDKNYVIEEKIYGIKQTSLIPAQAVVVEANAALESYQKHTGVLISNVSYLGKTKQQWEDTNTGIVAANASLATQESSLKNINSLMSSIISKYNNAKNLPGINPFVSPLSAVQQEGAKKAEMYSYRYGERAGFNYGGKVLSMAMGGMVPKYMARGGSMGSDTVPAMLTPGEFVVNKQAAKSFGPLLSMLNESKYPSMIGSSYDGKGGSGSIVASVNDNSSNVYNYSVGITVPQSNANPNDIARAVIGQIKYIDNQRIRGQR